MRVTIAILAIAVARLSAAPPPSAKEVLDSVRMLESRQQIDLDGQLRENEKVIPFHLTQTGPLIRYSFVDPDEVLQLRLDENGSRSRRDPIAPRRKWIASRSRDRRRLGKIPGREVERKSPRHRNQLRRFDPGVSVLAECAGVRGRNRPHSQLLETASGLAIARSPILKLQGQIFETDSSAADFFFQLFDREFFRAGVGHEIETRSIFVEAQLQNFVGIDE